MKDSKLREHGWKDSDNLGWWVSSLKANNDGCREGSAHFQDLSSSDPDAMQVEMDPWQWSHSFVCKQSCLIYRPKPRNRSLKCATSWPSHLTRFTNSLPFSVFRYSPENKSHRLRTYLLLKNCLVFQVSRQFHKATWTQWHPLHIQLTFYKLSLWEGGFTQHFRYSDDHIPH